MGVKSVTFCHPGKIPRSSRTEKNGPVFLSVKFDEAAKFGRVGYFYLFHVYRPLYEKERYTYRVLQTIQMKLILLCVWAERAVWAVLKLLKNSNMKFR